MGARKLSKAFSYLFVDEDENPNSAMVSANGSFPAPFLRPLPASANGALFWTINKYLVNQLMHTQRKTKKKLACESEQFVSFNALDIKFVLS